jgi:hypothetical protein
MSDSRSCTHLHERRQGDPRTASMQATAEEASAAAAAVPVGPDTDSLRHKHAKLQHETAEHRKRLDAIPPTVTMDLTVRWLTPSRALVSPPSEPCPQE